MDVGRAAGASGRPPGRCRRPGQNWAGPLALGVVTASLLGAAYTFLHLFPGPGNEWMGASSTDWLTLHRDPVLPWITSAVWVSQGADSLTLWLVVLPVSLALLARRLGVGPALVVGGTAHVLASLGSEGLLGIRYLTGGVGHGALQLLDVGPSYLTVGTVAGLVVAERGWARVGALAVLAGLLGLPQIGLLDGLGTLSVTPVGHVLATLLGAAAAAVSTHRRRPSAAT